MTIDPYRVLGVSETSRDAEIRAAYLALVRDSPPEKDPERFETVRRAYEAIATLPDRIETALFDRTEPTASDLFGLIEAPDPRPLSFETLRALLEKR